MTNEEIMTYIYKERKGSKIKGNTSLDKMRDLLNQLDNPQDKLKFVHVAGTNGKGSTTTMIANILKNSGYKVGKLISPFIISFNERIQVNNKFITDEELEEYINVIDPIVQKMEAEENAPSSYEILTAISFLHYLKCNCDIVVLETYVGGKYDPTNIISNTLVSVLTLIDFDHMELLGNTLEEITEQKCGIIKKDGITVTYPIQKKEVLVTIRKACMEMNNKLYIPNLKLLDIIKSNHNINYFSYKGTYYKLNMIGEFQIYNALMAILTANVLISLGYKISFSAITNGLFDTNFPARLEKLSDNPTIFVDGSHNPAGMKSLKGFLHEYKGKRVTAIVSATANKDYKPMIESLGACVSDLIFVEFINDAKKPAAKEDLLAIANEFGYEATTANSLEEALEMAKNKENLDLILITGSLYLASNYRNMLTKE